ncbi:hypothetical protein LXA43DRAFT_264974 [Ganoderma leucocontextum]|nr:hypothetical protein LXA43DRAFT_264974 [Ganoderma leucocontextum]
MPPKRKSDAFEPLDLTADQPDASGSNGNASAPAGRATKKARISDAGEGSSSGAKKGKKADAEPPKKWFEVVLDGEDEGDVPIYDDCNDIRRKIRALQKEPGFKVTQWLESIGKINNNSYQRFSTCTCPLTSTLMLTSSTHIVKATGPTGGAGNGTYYAAYIYFEKRRIAEGKKKTPKRLRAEGEQVGGLPREDRSHAWVFTGR